MTVSTSIQEDASSELAGKPHFREDQDRDVTHHHLPLSDTPRRTHRLAPGILSRHSDEDIPSTTTTTSSNHPQHFRHHSTSNSPEHLTQTQTSTAFYNSHPNDSKRQRSHSFDGQQHHHQQHQQHQNRIHHQQHDDYRAGRESRDPEMHDGSSSHWVARHERGGTSERRDAPIRSSSEERRFNPYNRHHFDHHHPEHVESGRIQGGSGGGDRRHQNEHSPSAGSNGHPEGDVDYDEIASDENNQEEDGEEEDDEEGSEENDEDGRDSKEGDPSAKNEDGTCSLTFSMYHNQKPVKVRSMFVDKLFKMVEDPSIQHLISWAKEGDMFYVYNCIELSDTILPRFFKHNNWQSFVRQLNMYGFHKIYRYDREESTLNRKRPESQRWQFYHPQFQRDFPHLRANIKRKSARSMNTAPATSRVVFEHGKGYFLQRNDRSRSNSGDGLPPPPPPPQSGQASMQGRHPENGSPASRHSPRDSDGRGDMVSRSFHDPAQASPDHRRQHGHPDERYAVKPSSASPHSAHEPHHPRLPPPGHGGFHPSSTSSDPHGAPPGPEDSMPRSAMAAVGHLRNHSLTSRVSYEKGSLYALGADAVSSPGPHNHHHHQGGPSRGHRNSDSALSPLSANGPGLGQAHHPQDTPHRPPRYHGDDPGGQPLSSSSSPRGPWPAGHHHLPSAETLGRSDDGVMDQRASVHSRHGSIPPEHMRPHPGLSSPPMHSQQQQYHQHPQQQQHDSHRRGRLHSMGGGPAPKDLPQPIPSLPSGSTFNTPRAPPPPTSSTSSSHANAQQQSGQPPLHPGGHATGGSPTLSPHLSSAKGSDPYVVIKELEHRLLSVEDAYMSLRQHTQKLQQIQVSQDRTIGWMRERLEQMADPAVLGRRDSIASPLTPQSTASFSGGKRRAEPSPEDSRSRPRYEQTPSSGPGSAPSGGAGGHIQSPDLHAYEHGGHGQGPQGPPRGHGRHESVPGFEQLHRAGSGPGQQQQHQHQQQQKQQHTLPSPQAGQPIGPYPRLLTTLGRIYS